MSEAVDPANTTREETTTGSDGTHAAVERTPLRPAHARATALVGLAVAGAVLGRNGVTGWNAIAAVTSFVLVWVAAIDLETRRLPDRIVLPTAAAVLVAALVNGTIVAHAVAAVAAAGLVLVAAILRPGDLGMGDVKLVLLLGALLGRGVVTALMLGFVLLAVVALLLVLRDGRDALRRHLPLAPFLAAGGIVTLLVSGT